MSARPNVEDLRMVISFEEFQEKISALIRTSHAISAKQVNTQTETQELFSETKNWYGSVYSVLKSSFNSEANHVEYQFHIECRALAKLNYDSNFPYWENAKFLKDKLLQAHNTLSNLTETLSVCSAIINYDEEEQIAINQYNSGQKLAMILQKLYKLRSDTYHPIQEILNGSGLKIDISETMELALELEEQDMIALIGRGMGVLRMKGKLWVEQNILQKEEKLKMKKNPTGKIFISHATNDKEIVSKFCDLILRNSLNITTEEIFNTSHQGTKPRTGSDFRAAIKDELIGARIVLQFISSSYKKSEACLNEMGAAWVLSENVIPLIIEKGEYDVGFINSTIQQSQLHNEEHLFRFTDELIEKGVFNGQVKNEVLFNKVREFTAWLTEFQNRKILNFVTDTPAIAQIDYSVDVEVITNYLLQKGYNSISISGLEKNINPKYNLEYMFKVIEAHPEKLTRTKLNGAAGIKIIK